MCAAGVSQVVVNGVEMLKKFRVSIERESVDKTSNGGYAKRRHRGADVDENNNTI